jgi:hypothetical protein
VEIEGSSVLKKRKDKGRRKRNERDKEGGVGGKLKGWLSVDIANVID